MLGKRKWVIPEGYIPPDGQSKSRERVSHEACCILNAGNTDANVEIMIFSATAHRQAPLNSPFQPAVHNIYGSMTSATRRLFLRA